MKTMIAKFPGTCACGCGKPITAGATINFWGRGKATLEQCTVDPSKLTTTSPTRPRSSYGSSYTRFAGGGESFVNRRGRCEDAPCCGCCS